VGRPFLAPQSRALADLLAIQAILFSEPPTDTTKGSDEGSSDFSIRQYDSTSTPTESSDATQDDADEVEFTNDEHGMVDPHKLANAHRPRSWLPHYWIAETKVAGVQAGPRKWLKLELEPPKMV
jgi:hypothetical protein